MLLLKGFQNDGDQLNVAVTQPLVLYLLIGTASVPATNSPGLLRLHLCLLQLTVGGMHLLQKLSPAHQSQLADMTPQV